MSNWLYPIRERNCFGFIDIHGNVVVPPAFEAVGEFRPQLTRITAAGQSGYIDNAGIVVVEPEYDTASDFSEGRAIATRGDRSWILNEQGQRVAEISYTVQGDFHDGLVRMESGGLFGFLDRSGEVAIHPRFERASRFEGGLAEVTTGGECFWIDTLGAKVNAQQNEPNLEPAADLVRAQVEGLYGYADPSGKLIIAPKFLCAADFQHDLALVMTESGLAYIDRNGGFVWQEKQRQRKQVSSYQIEFDFRHETLTYTEGGRTVEAVCGWWGQYRIFADTIREWRGPRGCAGVTDSERARIVRRAIRHARENHGLTLVVEELVDVFSQAS